MKATKLLVALALLTTSVVLAAQPAAACNATDVDCVVDDAIYQVRQTVNICGYDAWEQGAKDLVTCILEKVK